MRSLPTVVLVVLGLSIVALLATVAGLGGMAYVGYRQRLANEQAALKQAQEVAKQVEAANARVAQALEAAQTPDAQKPKAPRKPRTRPATQAAEDSSLQESPAEGQQEPEVKVIKSEDGSVVTVTQKKPGEYHMTATFAGGGAPASSVGALAAARRLKNMSLTDAQRNSIEPVNKQFEEAIKSRQEELRKARRAAFDELQKAQAVGDQRVIETAQEKVQETLAAQASAMSDLNKQYSDAVKPYLTPEQVAELDKAAQQPAPTAAASGMIMIQTDGQKPTVIVVPLPEGEATPNSEAPAPAP